MTEQERTYEGWAILELMGHRRLAGLLSEATIGGGAFLRIDVPDGDKIGATQFYSPGAVYAITPCSEETARRAAKIGQVAPVSEWELPRARIEAPENRSRSPYDDDDGMDRDDDVFAEAPDDTDIDPVDVPF